MKNWWGGSSNATTHLLDAMLYRGMVRIVRREGGVRIFAIQRFGPAPARAPRSGARGSMRSPMRRSASMRRSRHPVSRPCCDGSASRCRSGAATWQAAIRRAPHAALARPSGRRRLVLAGRGGSPASEPDDSVRLLAPFDPVVWDRARFALLWGWEYRFEAYTPRSRRKLGYYALPVLWRDRVVGWSTISIHEGKLSADFGWAGSAPRERAFTRELEAEMERMRLFLGLSEPLEPPALRVP